MPRRGPYRRLVPTAPRFVGIPTEEAEERAFTKWCDALSVFQYPELALMFHIPNGGHRHKAVAAKLHAMGVKRGVPDRLLPVARGGYHGLFIEMKRVKGGALSPWQRWWKERLLAEGYLHVVCAGWDRAREWTLKYLSWRRTDVVGEDRRRLCGASEDCEGGDDRRVVAAPGALLREPEPD